MLQQINNIQIFKCKKGNLGVDNVFAKIINYFLLTGKIKINDKLPINFITINCV